MASVPLSFTSPDVDNLTKLHIWESADGLTGWSEIEAVTAIGTYPDYIDHYTTANAVSAAHYFAIQWEDDKGAKTDLSQPLLGNTDLLINRLVKRVLERDSSLDRRIVIQEAEAVIEKFFGEDPYSPTISATYAQISGLTYLVLARSMIARVVSSHVSSTGNVTSATLGLVSFKSEAQTATAITEAQKSVEALIDLANFYLGISTSFVMQLEEVNLEIGLSSYDHSRLIGWVGLT